MTEITLPAAGTWTFDASHTSVGFVAKHLMVTKVRGTFGEVRGTVEVGARPEDSKVDVAIKTTSIDTGFPARDGHLRSPDFFDVENFPEMRFVSTSVEPHHSAWRLHGNLTIKDVTRQITLDVDFDGIAADPWGKTHAAFSARTEVDREDWGLNWNVALETGGWLVSKKVTIEIDAELVPSV
jgi:polyisoprenoid-binding protein YceI